MTILFLVSEGLFDTSDEQVNSSWLRVYSLVRGENEKFISNCLWRYHTD